MPLLTFHRYIGFDMTKRQLLSPLLLLLLFTLAILLNQHPVSATVTIDDENCVPEFDKCVIQRDCCKGLNCVTGDWQYTTDSTCLSPTSQDIEARKFSFDDKVSLVTRFYRQLSVQKTTDEVEKIIHKYRREFPKLIGKLERKYDTNFEIDVAKVEEQEL